MFNAFVDVIGHFYPTVYCHSTGNTYADVVHDGGDALPSEAELAPKVIEYKRIHKWEEIKAYRDSRLELGGYPTSGGWFHSDALSRDNYLDVDRLSNRAALQALQDSGQSKTWKTMSGAWVGLTVQLLDELLASKVAQKNQHFYSAEVLRIGLWLSNDPDNYDYKQNDAKTKWPPIYGE